MLLNEQAIQSIAGDHGHEHEQQPPATARHFMSTASAREAHRLTFKPCAEREGKIRLFNVQLVENSGFGRAGAALPD